MKLCHLVFILNRGHERAPALLQGSRFPIKGINTRPIKMNGCLACRILIARLLNRQIDTIDNRLLLLFDLHKRK